MKTFVGSILIWLMLNIFSFSPQKISAQQAQVSFQVFYDGLSPYGHWVDYPDRGYVWVPSAWGFVPYSTAGHWVYTDDGWMWISDYPWGWAPFHYGFWDYDDDFGWYWIPGEVWGPAWVSWRFYNGFYGWTPLGFGGRFVDADDRWCFINERYITNTHPSRYYLPRSQNKTYISNSTVISRSGPSRETIEKSTGRKITPVAVKSISKPGQSTGKNSVSIYKPTVSKSTKSRPNPAPEKVTKAKDMPHTIAAKQKAVASAAHTKTGTKQQKTLHQSSQPNHPKAQPSRQNASSKHTQHIQTSKQQTHSSRPAIQQAPGFQHSMPLQQRHYIQPAPAHMQRQGSAPRQGGASHVKR